MKNKNYYWIVVRSHNKDEFEIPIGSYVSKKNQFEYTKSFRDAKRFITRQEARDCIKNSGMNGQETAVKMYR